MCGVPGQRKAASLGEHVMNNRNADCGRRRMRMSSRAWPLVLWVLMIAMVAHGAPCLAQDVEQPVAPSAAGSVPSTPPDGRNSLFTPATYVELIVSPAPVGLRVYGFYIGEVRAPIVLFEAPIRAASFLTITPGFQYLGVPRSDVGKMTTVPMEFDQSYVENQARFDATVKFTIGHLEIGERNMYVRRFRPAWIGPDVNRYRNRLMLTELVTVNGRVWKPFTSYEAFHDGNHGGWLRYRFWSGVTLPLDKRVSIQPSYVRDDNRAPGIRDINYVMVALIANVR